MNIYQIKKRKDFFNFLFSFISLIIIILGSFILIDLKKDFFISFTEIILITFAVFRLTRLFVYDEIMQFFRDFFLKINFNEKGGIERKKYDWGIKRSFSDIFSCPWCFSFWASFFVYFFYIMFPPVTFFFIIVLTISGLASVIQIFVNFLGWSAENKKIKTESLEK